MVGDVSPVATFEKVMMRGPQKQTSQWSGLQCGTTISVEGFTL